MRLRIKHIAQPGELTLKSWVATQAERERVGLTAIYRRLYKGRYPQLERRAVNKRVVFVREP